VRNTHGIVSENCRHSIDHGRGHCGFVQRGAGTGDHHESAGAADSLVVDIGLGSRRLLSVSSPSRRTWTSADLHDQGRQSESAAAGIPLGDVLQHPEDPDNNYYVSMDTTTSETPAFTYGTHGALAGPGTVGTIRAARQPPDAASMFNTDGIQSSFDRR